MAYFAITFRLVDCVSLSETALRLDHMGDGFIITKVVSKGRLQTRFQREFKIELEHGDEDALSLVASGLLIGVAWVSKGVPDAKFSAQSLQLPLSFSSYACFSFMPPPLSCIRQNNDNPHMFIA